MSLFGLIPPAWRAGIITFGSLALLATAGGLYLKHRADIYREGFDDATTQIERELDLQEAANREAMRLAEKHYLRSVDAIALERDRLNDILDNLSLEAAADPGANHCGIGLGSVQRLNRIQ